MLHTHRELNPGPTCCEVVLTTAPLRHPNASVHLLIHSDHVCGTKPQVPWFILKTNLWNLLTNTPFCFYPLVVSSCADIWGFTLFRFWYICLSLLELSFSSSWSSQNVLVFQRCCHSQKDKTEIGPHNDSTIHYQYLKWKKTTFFFNFSHVGFPSGIITVAMTTGSLTTATILLQKQTSMCLVVDSFSSATP